MTKKKLLAASLIVLGSSGQLLAQLNSSVSVQGEYRPLIIETERLNTFPLEYKFELPASNLQYDYEGLVTDFKPGLLTMGTTGRQTDWPWRKRRGFVDFNMGSYLNTHLHAGYFFLSDAVQSLSADLKFDMSTLYRIKGVPAGYTTPARKRLYDGRIGVNYSRIIDTEGLLKAGAGYRAAYFNYYGTTIEKSIPGASGDWKVPTQTVNEADASVEFVSSPSRIRGWHAGGSVNFLSYRRLYSDTFFLSETGVDGRMTSSSPGDKETHLSAGGGYAFNFADFSAINIDAKGDFLFYSKPANGTALQSAPIPRHNYGIISLIPSYRYESNGVNIQAGLDVALSYDAMGKEPGKHFGAVHLAPDVEIDYRSAAGVALRLAAKGGVTPVTLHLREDFDRYQMPWLLSTLPVYTPIDATVGVNIGRFEGFNANVALRYAAAKNVPLGGWYQAYLGCMPVGNYSLDIPSYLSPYAQSVNLHGLSANLNLSYSWGRRVELAFDGSYTPQKGKRGIFNGFDRPRWILSANAAVRPIEKLKVEIGYEYRGVRRCYAWRQGEFTSELQSCRLPDVTDLSARVTYSLADNFDIYCKGANLLNRHTEMLPGLQSEGIAISGGFYLEF